MEVGLVYVLRPTRAFERRPGRTLPLSGFAHGIFALFTECLHLVEADSDGGRNLRL